MCGIAAIFNLNKEFETKTIERMVFELNHRGPDANNCVQLAEGHLGHTRLSIIDLDSGSQPMKDSTGRYWITFNGEIYNYKELREQLLSMGHCFNTNSDTEVILSAYAEWDTDCLNHFRGMFAFVIWDSLERRLFGARDLFGEKPLYYAMTSDSTLLVASEIKALTASNIFVPRLSLDSVDAYLALGYIPPDRTVYENVQTLLPGHYFQWDGQEVKSTLYWRPRFDTDPMTLDDAAERLRYLLGQAVQRQMVADVPIGAFLSGGLDSSSIVALMQQSSARPIKTFSVGFGSFVNELPYADAVAKCYKTEHHEIDLGMPPVAEMLERMADVYDEPFADSSHIPTYLISEFTRKHVKVALSGDGGDELFGGYWWYPPLALSEKVSASWLKWVVLRALSKMLHHRIQRLSRYSAALGQAVRWPDVWTRNIMSNMHFKASERSTLWGARQRDVNSFIPNDHYKPSPETSGMNSGFYFDLTSYLPGDILVKVDRAAMAHGLETRAPFLDRDLVEFTLSLPSTLKVDGDQTKILLKHACSHYWPPELRTRNKQGFGAPVRQWLKFPDVRLLAEEVFTKGSKLRRLLPGLDIEQQQAHPYRMWMLLTLGLWLQRHEVAV